MKIPIQDAIEILNMEGYDIPETDEEIYIDIPEEFTIEELYETVKDSMKTDDIDYDSIFKKLTKRQQNYLKNKMVRIEGLGVMSWREFIEHLLENGMRVDADAEIDEDYIEEIKEEYRRLYGKSGRTLHETDRLHELKKELEKIKENPPKKVKEYRAWINDTQYMVIPKTAYEYAKLIESAKSKDLKVGDWIRWEGDYGNVIEGQIEFINRTSSGFRYEIRTRDGETYSVYDYKGKITKI